MSWLVRVGKTHGQGRQDPSKSVPIFLRGTEANFCQDGSHLLGSQSSMTYCMAWVLFTAAQVGGLVMYRGFQFVWIHLAHRDGAAVRDCHHEI